MRKVKIFSKISEVSIDSKYIKKDMVSVMSTIDSPSRTQTKILLFGITSVKC